MNPSPPPLLDRLRDREDRTLSPFTGWTRESWALLADELLLAARTHASPSHAGIRFPGPVGGYGDDVDALEGFARTFLAAGFRVTGEDGADPNGYLEWYGRGLAAGVDPRSPERWPRLDEHHQARVEAASIALVLTMTGPWLWDRLPARTREQTVDYLSAAIGARYPPINWLWFQVVVEQFLASVGVDVPRDELAGLLARTDAFEREDGWCSDGARRAYDHYAGWALQFYPLLWSELFPDEPLAAQRRERYVARAGAYLHDAVRLVGADGSPLVQGRSLAYRFAAAAPFWAGARAGVEAPAPGTLRRAASGVARHFAEHGAPNAHGLLSTGWHGPWPPLAQRYSGPGSPYWAAKGLLGLSLPPGHPVWTAREGPLPVEEDDQDLVVRAPGWLVTGLRRDGVVRVVNHGTDHAVAGDVLPEGPLYSRLGYSTATSPVLLPADGALDQSVVLVDAQGRTSARTGFERLAARTLPSGTLLGASRWRAHVVRTAPGTADHGFPRAGEVVHRGPLLEVVSLVRRGWEVRLLRLPDGAGGAILRTSGWAVADATGARPGPATRLVDLAGLQDAGEETAAGASPLAPQVRVPWLAVPGEPVPGRWYAAAVALGDPGAAPHLVAGGTDADEEVPWSVAWGDGTVDAVDLRAVLSPGGSS
ncbi:DUF2264 domain-containing protein [Kineococcus sp. SYSU DK001]|uniref:DUF2264 domain-containing protein n=1 Tax=Kineococcus sp. SYSU DK001 TaxID=3383122 RepID=UPI003D7D5986